MRQLSIELSDEMAAIVDARIASGRNASESEVIQQALELLAERDASLEEWESGSWPPPAMSGRPTPQVATLWRKCAPVSRNDGVRLSG